jgi:AraC-like DNA-binding protein
MSWDAPKRKFSIKNASQIRVNTPHWAIVTPDITLHSVGTLSSSLPDGKRSGQNPNAAQILGSWTQTLLATVQAEGIDPREFLAAEGLNLDDFLDPNTRHSIEVTSTLWRRAAELTGNPCIGIEAVRFVNINTFQALGYSILASSTLREVFERYVRFSRFINQSANIQLKDEGERTYLIYDMGRGCERVADEAIDAAIAEAVQTSRNLLGPWVHPVGLKLRRPEPSPKLAFDLFFRAPIRFSAGMDVVIFESELLDRPLPFANEVLAQQTDEVVRKALDRIGSKYQSKPASDRVRQWLIEQLPNGEPTQISASKHLGVSLRSLQRHLSDEGVTFRDVVKKVRLELSLSYLEKDHFSILEISSLLGFNGSSSFSHAFRKWTGTAPTSFRRASNEHRPHLTGTSPR